MIKNKLENKFGRDSFKEEKENLREWYKDLAYLSLIPIASIIGYFVGDTEFVRNYLGDDFMPSGVKSSVLFQTLSYLPIITRLAKESIYENLLGNLK